MKRWSWLFLLVMLSLIFSSCAKLSKKGTAPSNIPPEVFMVNIPPDSANFSTLAKVYWYGFDQDGYIDRYQYLVIPDTANIIPKTGGYIDPVFVQRIEEVSPDHWNNISLDSIFQSYGYNISSDIMHAVDSAGTWDNVMLFASIDTAAIVSQYFFVRGVDDKDATSKIWKPDSEKGSNFRWYTRTNRPPFTTLDYDTMLIEYCLPETTVDWKGIKIAWSAEDPDYPSRSQPSFNYSWELFGPFESKAAIDTTDPANIYVSPRGIRYSSWNDNTASSIVDSTSRILVDLVNASGKDYGWYHFRVRAWDDAFVHDPTPAIANFRIIKPPFLFDPDIGKNVLLVDATSYDGAYGLVHRDTLYSFYTSLMESLKTEEIINDYTFCRDDPNQVYPPLEDTFSHYKLVIYYNENRFTGLQGYPEPIPPNDTGFIQIERYLRVGGRVWMIGQNNFGVDQPTVAGYVRISPVDQRSGGYTTTVTRVANYFCGVTGTFHPAFSSGRRNEEMIAAEPYLPHGADLPRLEVDTSRLAYYTFRGRPIGAVGIPRANWESVWNANYNERLYTFISLYGSQSTMHGRACASRAYSPDPWTFYDESGQPTLQWRTAEFCFPAVAINPDDMLGMMRVMVNWFLDENVYP